MVEVPFYLAYVIFSDDILILGQNVTVRVGLTDLVCTYLNCSKHFLPLQIISSVFSGKILV